MDKARLKRMFTDVTVLASTPVSPRVAANPLGRNEFSESSESVASVVKKVCSHCASGKIEDPSSYSLTRVVRLSRNQCSSTLSCKNEKC